MSSVLRFENKLSALESCDTARMFASVVDVSMLCRDGAAAPQ